MLKHRIHLSLFAHLGPALRPCLALLDAEQHSRWEGVNLAPGAPGEMGSSCSAPALGLEEKQMSVRRQLQGCAGAGAELPAPPIPVQIDIRCGQLLPLKQRPGLLQGLGLLWFGEEEGFSVLLGPRLAAVW